LRQIPLSTVLGSAQWQYELFSSHKDVLLHLAAEGWGPLGRRRD